MRMTEAEIQQILKRKPELMPARMQSKGSAYRTAISWLQYLRGHLFICVAAALFLAGMLIGTLLVGHASNDTRDLLQIILGGYFEQRQTQSFTAIALSTFSATTVALLILFFCGFCSIAQFIILLVPLFKGLGYGFSFGACYAQYGLQALPYVLLTLFPAMLLNTMLLLFACKTSFVLSMRMLHAAITPSEQSERLRMKRYCVKYGFYTAICMVIALLDAVLSYQLGALFVL